MCAGEFLLCVVCILFMVVLALDAIGRVFSTTSVLTDGTCHPVAIAEAFVTGPRHMFRAAVVHLRTGHPRSKSTGAQSSR